MDTVVAQALHLSGIGRQFERTYDFEIDNPNTAVPAKDAYNLLSGRYAIGFTETAPMEFLGRWTALETDGKGLQMVYYEHYDLNAILNALPFKEMQQEQFTAPFIRSLIDGDLVKGHLLVSGKEIPVSVTADPKNKGIIFYNDQGERTTLEQIQGVTGKDEQQKKHLPSPKPPLLKRRPGRNNGKGI